MASIISLIFLYSVLAVLFSDNAMLKTHMIHFARRKIVWSSCGAPLFSLAACSFWLIGKKKLYIISALIMSLWVFVRLSEMNYSTDDNLLMPVWLIVLSVLAFSCPVLDCLFRRHRIFPIVFLLILVVSIVVGDFIITNHKIEPVYVDELLYYMIRTLICCGILIVALVEQKKEGTEYAESFFVNLILLSATGIFIRILYYIQTLGQPDLIVMIPFSSIMWIVELGMVFFILQTFLIAYVFPWKVQLSYCVCNGLLLVGQEVLYWEEQLQKLNYFRCFHIGMILLYLYSVYYILFVKRKHRVTFWNSIFVLVIIPSLVYGIQVIKNML